MSWSGSRAARSLTLRSLSTKSHAPATASRAAGLLCSASSRTVESFMSRARSVPSLRRTTAPLLCLLYPSTFLPAQQSLPPKNILDNVVLCVVVVLGGLVVARPASPAGAVRDHGRAREQLRHTSPIA